MEQPQDLRHLRISVSEKRFSSGLDYLVKFSADIVLHLDKHDVEIEILSTKAEGNSAYDLAAAVEAIRRGAIAALRPFKCGAKLRIADLALHPVDFWPDRFEHFTREELTRAIDGRMTQNWPSDACD